MTRRQKKQIGCGTLVLGCLGTMLACLVIFTAVLFTFAFMASNGTIEQGREAQAEKEEEEQLNEEERKILEFFRREKEYDISRNGSNLEVVITSKEVPSFDLKESFFLVEFTEILKDIHQSEYKDFEVVSIKAFSPIIDSSGNKSQKLVATARFDKDSIDNVNWDDFLHLNLKDISKNFLFSSSVKRR